MPQPGYPGHSSQQQQGGLFDPLFAPDPMKQVGGLLLIIKELTGWASLSLEVFYRFNFGERYINPLRIFIGWGIFSTYLVFSGLLGPSLLLSLLALGYFPACIFHLVWIKIRKERGEEVISPSFGVSPLALLIAPLQEALQQEFPKVARWVWIDDWIIYRFIEPLPGLVVGAFCFFLDIDKQFAFWVAGASIGMFIKNNIAYQAEYNELLDAADARIKAKFYQAARAGLPKNKTAGVSLVRLAPDLRRAFDVPPPPPPSSPPPPGFDFQPYSSPADK